ncbi:MAG: substrate-binding domain-containing protein [Actinokineospora sp.]
MATVLFVDCAGDAEVEAAAVRTLVRRNVDALIYASMYHRVLDLPEIPSDLPRQAALARELGLSIPDDLSIVGFDDQEHVADGLAPGLTTIALPHYEMGVWAA